MVEEVRKLEKPEELLAWVTAAQLEMNLSTKDAEVILSYMEGHDYELGIRGSELVRVDIAEESPEIVPYTMDEVIDLVCEWNYELIEEATNGMANPKDFVDFCNYKDTYDELKKDEIILDQMFMQTKFGKKVVAVAEKMIMEVVGTYPASSIVAEPKVTVPPLPADILDDHEKGKVR